MNCFDQFCCGDGTCDNVCLHHPNFADRLSEIGGLRFDDLPTLRQSELTLPRYVPMIHHPYRRSKQLEVQYAAIDTYDIFRLKNGRYGTIADRPEDLRRYFRIADDATVILRGTAEDSYLERYWSYRTKDRAAEQIAALGISLAIGPNFSTFLDVPRTDALFNRKRQLICLAELSDAGVSVAPHLSATMPADWNFWRDFLKDNTDVRHIALNCQTGYKNPTQGGQAISRLRSIQENLGRPLSPVLIGGAQYSAMASQYFAAYTVIDSTAFFKTVYRQRPDTTCSDTTGFAPTWTLERQPLDTLLHENVNALLQRHSEFASASGEEGGETE
jgi:hypothetical protein